MANPLWSKPGTKHLDLGRGGGGDSKKMEYLLVVSLGVVIIGSVVFFIASLSGSGGTGVSDAKDMQFECTAETADGKVCKHQFTKSFEELNKERPQIMAEEMEGGTLRLDCPKCKAERSALPMVACPKCKKYFLLESTKMLADMQDNVGKAGENAQRPDLSTANDVCPHCGQDRIEWYREQYRKKKKK